MKLNIEFDELHNCVKKMGAKEIIFEESTTFSKIDIDLGGLKGIVVDPTEVDINSDGGGLLEYKGRQVLLFLPKQFNDIDLVRNDYTKGNKFHVADCSTLNQQRERGTFNNYSATNNISTQFNVYGVDKNNKKDQFDTKLNVCQNCLKKLNYKNFNSVSFDQKKHIVNKFTTSEFFETYSVLFDYLPTDLVENKTTTIFKNFTCNKCNTNFKNNTELLLNKNNSIICKDCYRKEVNHTPTGLTKGDIRTIYKERTKQETSKVKEWDDVYKYLDISLHNYIHRIKLRYPIPTHIGYIVKENQNIILDLVWIKPNKKSALVSNKITEYKQLADWTIFTLGQAMEKLNNKGR